MKKILSILLCSILVCSVFAGCSGGAKKDGASDKITILYPGDESERMTSFLAGEFAEKMKTDLGMTVEVIFVPWDQYWDKKDIMLANKEPIDLYWDGLPDLSTMVNKQQAMPIDALIKEHGQDMLKVLPMEQINGALIGGKVYGIPSAYAPSSSMFQLVCLRQDLLEEVGMTSVSNADDLMAFSKAITAKEPTIKGGGDPLLKPLTRYFGEEQYNWIAAMELVVFGEESQKCYSYFETEAFKQLSQFNRKMSLEGQYNDEVTIKYNERDSRVQTGNYVWVEGSLGKEAEIIDSVRANAPEAVLKSYLLAPEKPKYITAAGGEVICIPHSAPNPAGAMKFLNWLYKSKENYTFALYGVEGKDYEIKGDRIERLITDELFYEWMFRNQNYQMFSSDVDEAFITEYKNWDKNAQISKSFGFRFNNEKVAETEAKLIEQLKKFIPIATGFVDYETEYPKYIAELKAAGIDEYVAEVQRQMDEFLKK